MGVARKFLGGVQKAAIQMGGTAEALTARAIMRGDDAEKIEDVLAKIGETTAERLGKVDENLAKSAKFDQVYKEAKTTGNSSAKDAASGTSGTSSNPNDGRIRFTSSEGQVLERQRNPGFDSKKEVGDTNSQYIYSRDGEATSATVFKAISNAHIEGGGVFDDLAEEGAKAADDIAKTGFGQYAGIAGDAMKAHPFVSAGIAGGAGIIGANLFDSDDNSYS